MIPEHRRFWVSTFRLFSICLVVMGGMFVTLSNTWLGVSIGVCYVLGGVVTGVAYFRLKNKKPP